MAGSLCARLDCPAHSISQIHRMAYVTTDYESVNSFMRQIELDFPGHILKYYVSKLKRIRKAGISSNSYTFSGWQENMQHSIL